MRASTNIDLKARRRLVLQDFAGVDFSSSPLQVAQQRASDACNFINDFGITHKRGGWRELLRIEHEGEAQPINGIFQYKDGDREDVIVHAGRRFYRMDRVEDRWQAVDITLSGKHASSAVIESRLKSERSQAFLSKRRMYIVGCGDYLVYGTWDDGESYQLRRVYNDEDTYIPLTTAGIGKEGSGVQVAVDDVNLLTNKRRNRLLGLDGDSNYYLDATIDEDSEVVVRSIEDEEIVAWQLLKGALYQKKYSVGGAQSFELYDCDVTIGGADAVLIAPPDLELPVPVSGASVKIYENTMGSKGEPTSSTSPTFGGTCYPLLHSYSLEDGVIVGDGGSFVQSAGRWEFHFTSITLSATNVIVVEGIAVDSIYKIDVTLYPPACNYLRHNLFAFNSSGALTNCADILREEGRLRRPDNTRVYFGSDDVFSKYEVIFSHTPSEEEVKAQSSFVPYAERITGCSFGILYGADGATDRLFLSGNGALPNVDFYSEAEDFTYFGDMNTVVMGVDSLAVTGYARLSDSTLAVFKERANIGEATIFYRTGTYIASINDDADALLQENIGVTPLVPAFYTKAGNLGEAPLAHHATVDFGGDNLIVSQNGVFGIVLADNVATAQRYTRERSRLINARLTREPQLRDAVGVAYNGRYYLAVGGHCYVADARYKVYNEGTMDGAYNYEWWYWDNIPARVFAELDGLLTFGTPDGRICCFDGKEFADRTCSYLLPGELTVNAAQNVVTFSQQAAHLPVDGDSLCFDMHGVFGVLADAFVSVEDGWLRLSPEIFEARYWPVGLELVADDVSDSGLVQGGKYVLSDVDAANCRIRLSDAQTGAEVTPQSVNVRLLFDISGRELTVTQSMQPGAYSFRLLEHAEDTVPIRLAALDGEAPLFPTARIIHRQAVVARWYTPILDMGTAMSAKTLLRLSVTAEPSVRGSFRFGYETRKASQLLQMRGAGAPFSFEQLSFREFSFDAGFASSYTVRLNERNINYIVFKVESSEAQDCAIGSLEAMYKLNTDHHGVH